MLGTDAEEMERTLAIDAESQLNSLAAECERRLGRKVRAQFAQGTPDTEIADAAARLSVDLVIMGERGLTPARSPFLGGTTDRVFRRANCSVLAAKGGVSGPYERILV